jgi:formylglycine-generating enzyme required for sulfatase activity
MQRSPEEENMGVQESVEKSVCEATGATYVRIPAGKFLMGSPENEEGRHSDEGPQHEVEVAEFELMDAPVTNAMYRRFVDATGHPGPSHWSRPEFSGDDQPVVCVSFFDAQAYCAWASEASDRKVRLPTEEEWEYACRAGTKGPRYEEDLDAIAWHGGNSGGRTHPVRQKKPNAWGLFDMLGNAWQWCLDYYRSYNDKLAERRR